MAKQQQNSRGTGSGQETGGSQGTGNTAMHEAFMKALHANRPSDEAQEEAMRTVSEAAKGAASVDREQMEATKATAEARWQSATEFAKMADSAEERQHYFDASCKAEERESQERRDTGERSTNTQQGIAKIGAYVGLGAAAIGMGVLVAGTAYAGNKLLDMK